MFERLGVPFKAVIEEQELEQYSKVTARENLLVLPFRDRGLVAARNWIWDYARDLGTPKFWTFDDNIYDIYRLNRNLKVRMTSGTALAIIEDFIDRFANVPVAGMNYEMFCPRKKKWPPYLTNTRVYSNMLIDTFAVDRAGKPFRNEGFYNDDTDLCLRILKDGQCVVQINAFLINKIQTMVLKGGMTEHYQDDGRWKMAKELQEKHPDVVTITRKFGKWQHQVNYGPFRNNRLKLKQGAQISTGVNNYGMKLEVDREAAKGRSK